MSRFDSTLFVTSNNRRGVQKLKITVRYLIYCHCYEEHWLDHKINFLKTRKIALMTCNY